MRPQRCAAITRLACAVVFAAAPLAVPGAPPAEAQRGMPGGAHMSPGGFGGRTIHPGGGGSRIHPGGGGPTHRGGGARPTHPGRGGHPRDGQRDRGGRPPFHFRGPSHGGSHWHSRHHHKNFGFFFAPLFAWGYPFPYWYDYPYVAEPGPGVEEFEPYYSAWSWDADGRVYVARYFVTPDAWLMVLVYDDQPGLAYYYDPEADRFIGVLDLETGTFRHWYGEQGGWSEPQPFPPGPPPPP
ncbi:MAG: hypothetical protein AB1689_12395 [Thermodesulfobacteriota bacterium]